jgi:hypothetical protein
MCLLFLVPDRANREAVDDAWLADIYKRNDDGFGFMWHTKAGGPQHYKAVGPVADFIAAYRKMERHAKSFAVHVRMATHGAVETSQSHPYPIDDLGTAWLMHNGVLSTGNWADRSKSDTWHYINDTVAPLYASLGDGLFVPQLLDMMGDAIGNNRFILMDQTGGFHVVNRDQGLTWRGMWLSNTYAWSAVKYGAEKPRTIGGYGKTSPLYLQDEDWPWPDSHVTSYPSVYAPPKSGAGKGRGYSYRDAADWLMAMDDSHLSGISGKLFSSRVMDYARKYAHGEEVLDDLLLFSDSGVFEEQDVLDIINKNQYRGIEITKEQWDSDICDLEAELEAEQGYVLDEEEDDATVATIDADASLAQEINEALGERVVPFRSAKGGH